MKKSRRQSFNRRKIAEQFFKVSTVHRWTIPFQAKTRESLQILLLRPTPDIPQQFNPWYPLEPLKAKVELRVESEVESESRKVKT